MQRQSRIPNFYKYSVSERLRLLYEREWLSEGDFHTLMDGQNVMPAAAADKLVENVIGVFGLPLGLGLNFLINDRDFVVPMVVEEPSILAAVSASAKIMRAAGGIHASSSEPLLIGQIQVVDVAHPTKVRNQILQNRDQILAAANSLQPRLIARGGGARDIEVMIHPSVSARGDMVVLHLIVDTRDAMGANLVNSMCEGVAALVETLTGGKVFLRILSNLVDRAMVRAQVEIPAEMLAGKVATGPEVRDGIILAAEFAAVDPYRAATHNKGIMNGIDAVALATGNDWRAIEAGAHAWAGRGTSYASLTNWYRGDDGALVGSIEIPLKVGIVGAQVESNPGVAIAHRLLRIDSARELAQVMAAVGLAQNFAALRALSTDGIQQGHMTLHARSCVAAVGASEEIFDTAVEKLIETGEIKVWKAREVVTGLSQASGSKSSDESELAAVPRDIESYAAGHGKVILLGEHAAVYGAHAIAAPIPLAVQARVHESKDAGIRLLIPRWGVEEHIRPGTEPKHSLHRSLDLILTQLDVPDRNVAIEIYPHVPRAMGLGGSAAMAVAVIRAVARHFDMNISDERVNEIAYGCETIAHGTPSGIDNSLATHGKFMMFQKGTPPSIVELNVPNPIPIVIGITGVESLTAGMVAAVRTLYEGNRQLYQTIFDQIDGLAVEAIDAIESYSLPRLGELMNVSQGLLNALGVSSWELEELIQIAREQGALGAKLTGSGGGGAMVALCPESDVGAVPGDTVAEKIADAMRRAGYRALVTEIG